MSKPSPLRGLAIALLILVPLALVRCKNDDGADGNPTAPQRSGSLSVSIAASPTSGRAPLEVAFTSEVSGGGGRDSYVYAWSFGDGTASSEANPRVRFTSGGVYPVVLRVVSGSDVVGDGATSAERATQHVYASPGTYTATATVTIGAARGTCSINVNVS